jgi:mono/diheme cytochrome c family protein
MNPSRAALAALLASTAWFTAMAAQAQRVPDAAALVTQHRSSCHGAQRTGGMGPAVLPESLERLRRPEAQKVMTQGRVATQMPAFADKLKADIRASRVEAASVKDPVGTYSR